METTCALSYPVVEHADTSLDIEPSTAFISIGVLASISRSYIWHDLSKVRYTLQNLGLHMTYVLFLIEIHIHTQSYMEKYTLIVSVYVCVPMYLINQISRPISYIWPCAKMIHIITNMNLCIPIYSPHHDVNQSLYTSNGSSHVMPNPICFSHSFVLGDETIPVNFIWLIYYNTETCLYLLSTVR